MAQSRYELLVGLDVTDEAMYATYRREMRPVLDAFGGRFEYDFTIDATLQSRAEHPINRLFVLSFPSQQAREGFFADPAYQTIRTRCFKPSVAAATIIATWHHPVTSESPG
jgi:uncharacterized protein (DUF1330 family)